VTNIKFVPRWEECVNIPSDQDEKWLIFSTIYELYLML
jgi:hypothetical protein